MIIKNASYIQIASLFGDATCYTFPKEDYRVWYMFDCGHIAGRANVHIVGPATLKKKHKQDWLVSDDDDSLAACQIVIDIFNEKYKRS